MVCGYPRSGVLSGCAEAVDNRAAYPHMAC
jgi:hypothetical protein